MKPNPVYGRCDPIIKYFSRDYTLSQDPTSLLQALGCFFLREGDRKYII